MFPLIDMAAYNSGFDLSFLGVVNSNSFIPTISQG